MHPSRYDLNQDQIELVGQVIPTFRLDSIVYAGWEIQSNALLQSSIIHLCQGLDQLENI